MRLLPHSYLKASTLNALDSEERRKRNIASTAGKKPMQERHSRTGQATQCAARMLIPKRCAGVCQETAMYSVGLNPTGEMSLLNTIVSGTIT